jgi:hypothetical protein
MKEKEPGWKDNLDISTNGTEDCQGNIILDLRQVLKMWENHITELYDEANQPQNLEPETEKKWMTTKKTSVFCTVKWKKLPRRQGIKRLQGKMMYLQMYSNWCETMV